MPSRRCSAVPWTFVCNPCCIRYRGHLLLLRFHDVTANTTLRRSDNTSGIPSLCAPNYEVPSYAHRWVAPRYPPRYPRHSRLGHRARTMRITASVRGTRTCAWQ